MPAALPIEFEGVPETERNLTGLTRLVSIDAFRGLLVAGMVVVTNPGTYEYVYAPLLHAKWNGATLTDMIFPSFLFLAGLSIVLSFQSRRKKGERTFVTIWHIVLRSTCFIGLGLLLNLLDLLHVSDWRLPGVLQRIGLCYFFGGFIYVTVQKRNTLARCAAVLVAALALVTLYWASQTLVPVPGYGTGALEPASTLSAYLDRSVFTTTHLWHWGGPGQMWDPEGLLTTLPAIANLLIGIVAGELLKVQSSNARKMSGMVLAGAVLVAAGLALNPIIPINKKIWTPSFVLLSGGFSVLVLALLHWLVDQTGFVHRRFGRLVARPFLIYGSNAILGFILASILSSIFGVIRLPGSAAKLVTIPEWSFQWLAAFLNPWNASMAYAIGFTGLIMFFLLPLYTRRIFIRL